MNSGGGVALATIKEIKEEVVLLDLNHPLAGKDLTFEVEIIEVNQTSNILFLFLILIFLKAEFYLVILIYLGLQMIL